MDKPVPVMEQPCVGGFQPLPPVVPEGGVCLLPLERGEVHVRALGQEPFEAAEAVGGREKGTRMAPREHVVHCGTLGSHVVPGCRWNSLDLGLAESRLGASAIHSMHP